MKINNKYLFLILTIVLFLIVWYFLAVNLTAWSDEIGHMAVGKGLLESGSLYPWNFDSGKLQEGLYTRAKTISYLTKIAYQIGGFSLLSARMVPLIFTLLTFLTFAAYIRKRYRATTEQLVLAAILFFGQSMVLEKALYVRMYAPLGFLMLLGLIAYWEGLKSFAERKYLFSGMLWLITLVSLAIPTIDTWQYQQFPMILLAILIGFFMKSEKALEYLWENRGKIYLLLLFLIITAPLVVVVNNYWVANLRVGSGLIGSSFVTYWDNLAGLVRFGWALNICFLGIFLPLWGRGKLRRDFETWLFLTGIISGIVIGLYNPHNFIFWSRFFYVPVVLAVLGFSGILLKLFGDRKKIIMLVAIYLLLNLALSFTTFYYDRNNIRKPIDWLNNNLGQNDVLLVFSAELGLHGGEKLVKYANSIRPSQDPEDIRRLIDLVSRKEVKTVYFLYSAHHEAFKGKLYTFTTFGDERLPPSDLFRYLRDRIPGEQVMSGLRGCGLIRYNKEVLVAGLRDLLKNGYPPSFVGIERRLAVKLKNVIWPKVEEDAGRKN